MLMNQTRKHAWGTLLWGIKTVIAMAAEKSQKNLDFLHSYMEQEVFFFKS